MGLQEKIFSKQFSKQSHSAEIESFSSLRTFTHCKTLEPMIICCRLSVPILKHYRRISPRTKKLSRANQKRARKTLNFGSQTESIITSHKNTREFSARVEAPSWVFAQVGSPMFILIHEGLHAPSPDQLTLLLLTRTFPKNWLICSRCDVSTQQGTSFTKCTSSHTMTKFYQLLTMKTWTEKMISVLSKPSLTTIGRN